MVYYLHAEIKRHPHQSYAHNSFEKSLSSTCDRRALPAGRRVARSPIFPVNMLHRQGYPHVDQYSLQYSHTGLPENMVRWSERGRERRQF